MPFTRVPLYPDKVYHVFNHAVGNDCLFRTADNYVHFLRKYAEYTCQIWDTYAYCLLPNHFHFVIRIKPEHMLRALPSTESRRMLTSDESVCGWLSHQFGSFQNSYARHFNLKYNRKGSLFMQSFGRKPVEKDSYFSSVIHYVHFNAVHHGLVNQVHDWPYTSYHSYFSKSASRLNREEIVEWFGGMRAFETFHLESKTSNFRIELEDF